MRKESIALILVILVFFLCGWVGVSVGASVLEASPSEIFFQGDFNEELTDKWTVVDDPATRQGPSNWYVSKGALVQNSNLYGGTSSGPSSTYLATHLYTGNSAWRNYAFSTRLCPLDNDGIDVLFRYVDKDNYYRFFMVRDRINGGPFRALQKRVAGKFTTLKSDKWKYKQKKWYKISVTVKENNIKVYMDDALVFNVNDNSLPRGKIALFTYAMGSPGALFDSIEVTPITTQEIFHKDALKVPFRGHSYLVVTQAMTWQKAKSYAESLGGHLVTISDKEENTFVADLAREKGVSTAFWIGLTDDTEEGVFVWVTGEPLAYTYYTNWYAREQGDEDYVAIGLHSKYSWSDDNGERKRPFVVEFEAPAASAPAETSPSEIVFQDDFSKSMLNPRWTWVRQDSTHWSLTEHPGYLRITIQHGTLWKGHDDARNLLVQPAPSGDFDLLTCVTIKPTINWQQAGLLIYQDDDNYLRLISAYDDGRKVSFVKEVSGSGLGNNIACNLTATYLKVTKRGNTYTGFYSADGSSWIEVYRYTDIDFSNLKIGLTAFHSGGWTEIPADFDFFSVHRKPVVRLTPTPTLYGDVFRLSTGTVIFGKFLYFDGNAFKILTEKGVVEKTREEIITIWLGGAQ